MFFGSPSADGQYQHRRLTGGATLHATNGIRIGPFGLLYVASDLGRNISVVEPHTGWIVDQIGTERGVESPDDLAFGPDGSLYWTAFLTGEVARRTPAGNTETVAQLGPGVNSIAFSPDGRLFVTRVFLGDELYELDPDGNGPPQLVASGLGGLNSMEFGPDGNLYGPLWFANSIVRVDVDTGAKTPLITGLEVPSAITFDDDATLYALDQKAGQIITYDLDTGAINQVADLGEEGADDLVVDHHGNIFVTNSHDGWLRRISPGGHTRSLLREGLTAPGGVAVVSNGGHESVFVADVLSMKALDPQTGHQTLEAHSVIGVSPLATPITATADAGKVLTTSWFANVVQDWDPAVETVVESHSDFATPLNAVRYQGDLVVAELGTHSVVRRPDATLAKQTLAQLPVPTGLATDGDSLWAADWATGRVLRIAQAGQALATPEVVAQGLSNPEGLAVDTDGTLLVVETGADQLTRIDPATGETTVVEDGLDVGLQGPPGLPPTYVFNGVDTDADGNIYVSLAAKNTVEKLTPKDGQCDHGYIGYFGHCWHGGPWGHHGHH